MDRPIQRFGQTEAPIDLAEKYHPTVTGTIAAGKTASKSFGVHSGIGEVLSDCLFK